MLARYRLSILLVLTSACASNAPAPPAAAPSSPASESAVVDAHANANAPPVASAATATDVLTQNRGPFDACYARARAAKPDLGRTAVEISFALDDAGKPMTVDLQYRHRMDEAAKECLRTAALALKFPASLRGKQTGTITFTPSP